MKILPVILLLLAFAPVRAEEVKIIFKNITKTDSEIRTVTSIKTVGDKKVTEEIKKKYNTFGFLFILYNNSTKPLTLPTKFTSATYGAETHDKGAPKYLTLSHMNFTHQAVAEQNIPAFVLVYPDSDYSPVVVKPGEGTMVGYTMNLSEEQLQPGDTVIIKYEPNTCNNRYEFWQGKAISPAFVYQEKKTPLSLSLTTDSPGK